MNLKFFSELKSDRWIDETFRILASEPIEAVVRREQSAFDEIASPNQNSILLFGCGQLGRFVLQGLRASGVAPVAFVDNNERLWGTEVDGLIVLSPSEAVQRHNQDSCFVVTVYHGLSVTQQLKQLGCTRILPVVKLFWKYSGFFIPASCTEIPHRIPEQEHDIRAGYALFSDDASRREFCEQILWRFRPDPAVLSPYFPERETYFPDDLVTPIDDEVFVDCGAFNGDSARSFLAHRKNRFGRIYAVEPDPGNRDALREWADSLDNALGSRITALPYGVSDQDATLFFNITNTAGSTLLTGETESSIECRKLDTLFAEESPTYIKMDIEGAEPQAIAGGAHVLRSSQPVLAICVYHRCEHMWQLPSLIHSIFPGYHLFLRRYAEDCWEMVCYAVPPGRLVPGSKQVRGLPI